MLRASSPDRKRFVPLAAPRQVDLSSSRVGNTHLKSRSTDVPSIIHSPIQEVNVRPDA
jgi:hypothetical protein